MDYAFWADVSTLVAIASLAFGAFTAIVGAIYKREQW